MIFYWRIFFYRNNGRANLPLQQYAHPATVISHGHALFRQAELVHEGEALGRRRNHAVRRRAHGATARALELLRGKDDQHGAAARFEVQPRARRSGARLQQKEIAGREQAEVLPAEIPVDSSLDSGLPDLTVRDSETYSVPQGSPQGQTLRALLLRGTSVPR